MNGLVKNINYLLFYSKYEVNTNANIPKQVASLPNMHVYKYISHHVYIHTDIWLAATLCLNVYFWFFITYINFLHSFLLSLFSLGVFYSHWYKSGHSQHLLIKKSFQFFFARLVCNILCMVCYGWDACYNGGWCGSQYCFR